MRQEQYIIAFGTIVRKEVMRFLRIWSQTLLPSVVTTVLYFLIFGTFIGSQVGDIHGVSYMQFLVPGLVMMSIISNSFGNVVSSFFGSKFQRNIEELLVAPVPPFVVVAGYVTGGVLRGMIVGGLTLLVAYFFTDIPIRGGIGWIIGFSFLTALLFSLAGLINAIYAKTFDGITIVQTFVLTPLTYLGGVFYSISMLPPFWQWVSQANPILYMVNGFRYGFFGAADVSLWASIAVLLGLIVLVLGYTLFVFRNSDGMRN